MSYDRKDAYYRRARASGFRARSAYKLTDLDRRFRLLRPGDFVVDLGCWPGGWLQVAVEAIGPSGRIVGVDLAPLPSLGAPNALFVQGDVLDASVVETMLAHLGRRADVVLSDLSPKLTGIRATDEARTAELAAATLSAVASVLRPGGRVLMKVFMSPDYEALVKDLRGRFETVHATRAEATRRGSAELYVVGVGFHG